MVSAIILAAGESSRMNGINKQLEKIGGTPVFVMSALKFEKISRVGEIIIAAPSDDVLRYEKMARNFGVTKLAAVVSGGSTRFESTMNALAKVSAKADYIAIHDGARPLIDTVDIERVIADAEKYKAAIAAAPTVDTIKIVGANGFVEKTIPREKLYSAQTPQVFEKRFYLSCLEKADKHLAANVTDDSAIAELAGEYVHVTEIASCNMKITRPEDLAAAQAVYDAKRTVKVV